MNSRRPALTLLELIIVIGIGALLLALLIPGVQAIRESARQVTCQNNLKQNATAVLNFESGRASLPSLYNGSFLKQPKSVSDEFHFHSWRTALLPFLEQEALYESIRLDKAATDPANLAAIATPVSVFICPSTSNPSVNVPKIGVFSAGAAVSNLAGPVARSDYEAIIGLSPDPAATSLVDLVRRAKLGPWGSIQYQPNSSSTTGATVISQSKGRIRDTTDGLSQTLLIGERAGRPDYYNQGKLSDAYPYDSPNDQLVDSQQAAWGISTTFPQLLFSPAQTVNNSNYGGLYGFHSAGANVAFFDGSVRLLSRSTNTSTLNALVTRSNSDIADLE